jgi:arabinan endo-1,5-alpha-L-arabinosidase
MFTSLLITSATATPLLVPFGLAASIVQAGLIPKGLAPRPIVSGIYPEPEPCHGNCSWIHDPAILYEDGTYWRFTTSGNIGIANAPSLEGPWTYRGALLDNGTIIHLRDDQDIWVRSRNHLPATIIH